MLQLKRASLVSIAFVAASAAGPALGHGGEGGEGGDGGAGSFGGADDTAQLQISGSIPGTCSFTTTPNVTSLGTLADNSVTELGSLGFTCNLATVSAVNLTVKAEHGALTRDGGTESVNYAVAWNVQGSSDVFNPTAPWTTASPFTLSSGLAGVEQIGIYKVRVTGPVAGKPAGTYRDTITYTISP